MILNCSKPMKTIANHFLRQRSVHTQRILMSKTHFLPAAWRAVFTLVLLALAAFVVPLAQAQSNFPPDRLTYQGFLVDGNGNALATNAPKNYDVIFRIYATQTGTNSPLWGEQQTVTVDKGYFSVLLGEGTVVGTRPSFASLLGNSTNSSERYVGLTVKGIGAGNSDVDILPRLRLLPAPYAFLARGANALVGSGGSNIVTVSGNAVSISGPLAATSFSGTFTGSAAGLSGLTSGQIPNLDAGKITTGTLNTSRIPNLDAGKITAGSLADARLSANVALRSGGNTFSGSQVFNQNVGIGTTTTDFPLNFATALGDKISLFDGGANGHYGFGVQSGVLQIHADNANNDIAFGYGVSTNMTERMRIRGNGSVGIGTNNPSGTGKLHIRQNAGVTAYNSPIYAILIDNAGHAANGRGGFRFSDDGYLDATVLARDNNPVVARLNNSGNWSSTSDGRVKKDVTPLNGTLEKVLRLRPVNYHFTNQTSDESLNMGFIAQEVQREFPSLVTPGDMLTLNYSGLGVVAIGAIQELNQQVKAENKSLRDSLDAKDAELAGVKDRLAALEELVRKNLVGAQRAAK